MNLNRKKPSQQLMIVQGQSHLQAGVVPSCTNDHNHVHKVRYARGSANKAVYIAVTSLFMQQAYTSSSP